MRRNKSRYRQQLRQIEESRAEHVDKILNEQGPMRRGSFVTLRRRCGKPNCHCATGEGHPAHYLSVKEGGQTRMIYIADFQAAKVAEEAKHYRQFRQARAKLAKLARQSLEVIDALEKRLLAREEIAGQKKQGRRPSGKAPPTKKG